MGFFRRAPQAEVAAWDLPVRLFHWVLVVCVVSAWVSFRYAEALGDVTLVWHRVNGLFVLVLIVFRVLWGIVGSSTARFSQFVRGPRAVVAYMRQMFGGSVQRFLGHNPLGALMVLALLAIVAAQAGFGLFAVDDNDLTGGPLYRLVGEQGNRTATAWHAFVFYYVLLPCIALHIAANLAYGFFKRERLVRAMVVGTKPLADYADAEQARIVSHPMFKAMLCLVLSLFCVLGGMLAMGGSLRL